MVGRDGPCASATRAAVSAAAALLPRLFVDRELKFGRTWEGCLGIENATWEIVYTSPSLTGVRATALAGLAVTPHLESAIIAGLRRAESSEPPATSSTTPTRSVLDRRGAPKR